MRADDLCDRCRFPVRWCEDIDGRPVVLNVHAHPQGICWVQSYAAARPIIVCVADPRDVPASEPLRYFPHRCQES